MHSVPKRAEIWLQLATTIILQGKLLEDIFPPLDRVLLIVQPPPNEPHRRTFDVQSVALIP